LEGARIASRSLRTAVREPHNIGARSDMMMSSMMGAIAFQKDLGAVHSCAHALSTVADLHHGLANGIMIDHVMRFNMPSAIAKMAELAHVVGAAVPGALPEASAEGFIGWLARLKADLAIPATLSAYRGKRQVTKADIEALADVAINDTCHQTNPRPCTRQDFKRLFAEAM
jgi:alcohol dehydrogenase class IV